MLLVAALSHGIYTVPVYECNYIVIAYVFTYNFTFFLPAPGGLDIRHNFGDEFWSIANYRQSCTTSFVVIFFVMCFMKELSQYRIFRTRIFVHPRNTIIDFVHIFRMSLELFYGTPWWYPSFLCTVLACSRSFEMRSSSIRITHTDFFFPLVCVSSPAV
jgi:hypothetical protein